MFKQRLEAQILGIREKQEFGRSLEGEFLNRSPSFYQDPGAVAVVRMRDILLPLLIARILPALNGRSGRHGRAILPRMSFDPFHPPEEIIEEASRVIRAGGVVLHPSDTVYGLACDPFNREALRRLLQIKGRPEGRGFLLIVHNLEVINDVSDTVNKVFYELTEELWPGPVTLLLKGRKELPPALLGERGQLGVRFPELPFLKLWVENIPGPVVSTSANLSGEVLPESVSQLRSLFGERVDLFLEGGEVDPGVKPSTVIDLTVDPPCIVREGQRLEQVKESLRRRG